MLSFVSFAYFVDSFSLGALLGLKTSRHYSSCKPSLRATPC